MIETEIKFAIDTETARKLLASRAIAKLNPRSKRVVSTYYDTRQHLFRRHAAALRVRQRGRKFEQTIKVPANGPMGMQTFEEYTVSLKEACPDLNGFDADALAKLGGRKSRLKLSPQFTTDVKRTTAILTSRRTKFEMAVDIGELRSHGTMVRTEPVCEVEFELIKGNVLHMLDAVARLAERFDFSPLHLTKAARGYALARPSLKPRLQKAAPVALAEDIHVGEAFQQIVGEALTHLFANRAPALAGRPGGIHQTRVATRRLRAALRAFKKILPYDKRKAFNGEFRWLLQRLGPARDWHVFIDETMVNLAEADVDIDYAALRRVAVAERRRVTAEAIEVLQSRRYTRLMLQFQRWMLTLEQDHSDVAERPLKEFAIDVFEKTRRDLFEDPRPLSRFKSEERHEIRKKGKKARYATEFFAQLWTGDDVEPYLAIMEDLQDHLGEANDASVARHLLATVPINTVAPETVVAIGKWSDRRIRERIRTGQPLWRKLQRSHPFWH